jgi:hypothetical protein
MTGNEASCLSKAWALPNINNATNKTKSIFFTVRLPFFLIFSFFLSISDISFLVGGSCQVAQNQPGTSQFPYCSRISKWNTCSYIWDKDYKFLVRKKSIGIITKQITRSGSGNYRSGHRCGLSPHDYYACCTSTRLFCGVLFFAFVISPIIGGIFVPFKNPRGYRKHMREHSA